MCLLLHLVNVECHTVGGLFHFGLSPVVFLRDEVAIDELTAPIAGLTAPVHDSQTVQGLVSRVHKSTFFSLCYEEVSELRALFLQ